MSTLRKSLPLLLCAPLLLCGAVSASATSYTFNFNSDTAGSTNFVDYSGPLGIGVGGADTVCDSLGNNFASISGNAVATGICAPASGGDLSLIHISEPTRQAE